MHCTGAHFHQGLHVRRSLPSQCYWNRSSNLPPAQTLEVSGAWKHAVWHAHEHEHWHNDLVHCRAYGFVPCPWRQCLHAAVGLAYESSQLGFKYANHLCCQKKLRCPKPDE